MEDLTDNTRELRSVVFRRVYSLPSKFMRHPAARTGNRLLLLPNVANICRTRSLAISCFWPGFPQVVIGHARSLLTTFSRLLSASWPTHLIDQTTFEDDASRKVLGRETMSEGIRILSITGG
jgi:hypothetical protein